MKFVDAQVGASCVIQYGPACSFTVNGGRAWTSRSFAFPSDIQGYSFPGRDRMYVVGDHGMIYRYRVVPAEYKAKGILDAPMMPASAPATQ